MISEHARRGKGLQPGAIALIARARELVRLARENGYRRDELLEMIEQLP